MKHLALLAALLTLWSGSAFAAGLAIITGTGTGGSIGTSSAASGAATTLATPTTTLIPSGSLLVVAAGFRNSAVTITSFTDSAATPNTYSAGAVTLASTNQVNRTFYSVTTSPLPAPCTVTASMAVANTLVVTAALTCPSSVTFTNGQAVTGTSITAGTTISGTCTLSGGTGTCTTVGDAGTPTSETVTVSSTVTGTYSSTTGGKTQILVAFSNPAASPFDAASTTATGTGTGAISVGPTGTLACPGGGAGCEVLVANLTYNIVGTPTEDAAFTSLGSTASGAFIHAAYKIVSSVTAVTYAPSLTGASGTWGALLQGFEGTGAVAASADNRLLLGVGQ